VGEEEEEEEVVEVEMHCHHFCFHTPLPHYVDVAFKLYDT
jgi:hypothetical protein